MDVKPTYKQLEQKVKKLEGKITSYKTLVEDLNDNQENFYKIFNSLVLGIGISDIEVNFLEINDAVAKLTGYTREELLKNTTGKLYATIKDRVKIFKIIKKNKFIVDFEVQFLTIPNCGLINNHNHQMRGADLQNFELLAFVFPVDQGALGLSEVINMEFGLAFVEKQVVNLEFCLAFVEDQGAERIKMEFASFAAKSTSLLLVLLV